MTQPGVLVINPFTHLRSLFSDFTVAGALLKIFVQRVAKPVWLQPGPVIFIQLPRDAEGGYTQIERRVAREVALGAGASGVVLCIEKVWTDQEMLELKYSARHPVGE